MIIFNEQLFNQVLFETACGVVNIGVFLKPNHYITKFYQITMVLIQARIEDVWAQAILRLGRPAPCTFLLRHNP